MTPLEHAEELVRYFAQMHPADPARWAHGLRLARDWRRLVRSPAPPPDEAARLVEELQLSNDSGSGWHDLKTAATAWARRQGLYPRST